MRSLIIGVFAAAAMASSAAAFAADEGKAAATACPDKATMEANKKLVNGMFKADKNASDSLKSFYDMLDPGYVQHNPEFRRFGEINNLHGREEFMALMPMMMRADGPFAPPPADAPVGNPLYKVMADCDMIVVLQQKYLPDPQHKGKYYEAFWFDAWRVKNGKLAEHWDPAEIPSKLPDYLLKPLSQLPKDSGKPSSAPAAAK
jgi:predicted SnoaL-like aldol condensation-catalyzing enzyme